MSPPEDDATIEGSTRLYRRIDKRFLKRDGEQLRVSGGAFQNTSGTNEMSVSLGDTVASEGRDPATLIDGFEGFGLMALTAEFVRSEEQVIQRSPQKADPAHGDVIGEKKGSRRKKFAANAEWVVVPT